jgi:hypothetical protein
MLLASSFSTMVAAASAFDQLLIAQTTPKKPRTIENAVPSMVIPFVSVFEPPRFTAYPWRTFAIDPSYLTRARA